MWFKKELFNLGSFGEKIALKYLKENDYEILEKNYTNHFGRRLGEIDIISKKENEYIFVEVKTSYQKKQTVMPEERINHQKLHKLNKIATHYLKTHNLEDCNYRFDAISIIYNSDDKKASIKHLNNIFL